MKKIRILLGLLSVILLQKSNLFAMKRTALEMQEDCNPVYGQLRKQAKELISIKDLRIEDLSCYKAIQDVLGNKVNRTDYYEAVKLGIIAGCRNIIGLINSKCAAGGMSDAEKERCREIRDILREQLLKITETIEDIDLDRVIVQLSELSLTN